MKRFFLFMFVLFVGITLVAQETKNDSVGNVLYEQAIKAIENKRFIIRIDTYEWSGGRKFLDNRTNFLKLENGVVSSKYDDGRADSDTWTGVTHIAKVRTCKASDIKIEYAESISTIIPINYSNYIEHAHQAKIVLEKEILWKNY